LFLGLGRGRFRSLANRSNNSLHFQIPYNIPEVLATYAAPTMLSFDSCGKPQAFPYGARPDLHEQIEKTLKKDLAK
jgi:hypothetical protein